MDARHEHGKEVLSQGRLSLLSFFWLGYQFFFAFAMLIWLPAEVSRIYPPSSKSNFRATAIGILFSTGALVFMFAGPLFGYLSDIYTGNWSKKLGNRMPFVILGTLGMAGSSLVLGGLAYFDIFALIVVGWAMIMFFSGMIQAPYTAIIPDKVLREQYGSASGWMTGMIMLGNMFGGILGAFQEQVGVMKSVFIVTFSLLLFMVFACFLNHKQDVLHVALPRRGSEDDSCFGIKKLFWNVFKPFSSPDFTWLFLSRAVMGMGYSTVQQFLLLFMEDVVEKPYVVRLGTFNITAGDEKVATSYFLIIMLFSALLSSLIGGFLSDRIGRRTIVYGSGILQSVAVLLCVIPFFQGFRTILILGGVFGLGYGAYQSVHFALATEILPHAEEYGKDMGIWNLSGNIPSMLAPLFAGLLLDLLGKIGEKNHLGYTVVFGLSVIWFVVGTALVIKIRLYNRNQGQALDVFFSRVNEVEEPSAEEIGLSDMDRFDEELSSSSGESAASGGYIESGNLALDDFVSGNLDLNDLSFGSDNEP